MQFHWWDDFQNQDIVRSADDWLSNDIAEQLCISNKPARLLKRLEARFD